jgi:hypothetical protein
MLASCWIAAASAIDSNSQADAALSATRIAILVIAILAFVESIVILITSLSGLDVDLVVSFIEKKKILPIREAIY